MTVGPDQTLRLEAFPMKTAQFSVRAILSIASACFVPSAIASANTWIVDINNGAGANFTQITVALAGSQAGDVIIVRPGTYTAPTGGLAIDKGVTIIGQGLVKFSPASHAEISGVPAGDVLVIVNLSATSWIVGNSQGSITIRESTAPSGVRVTSCSDVRVQALAGIVGTSTVTDSRCEIADCTLRGAPGQGSCCWGFPGGSGWSGLTIDSGSLVHLARSSALGGSGGDSGGGPASGGAAGAGVAAYDSELRIDGGGVASIQGGVGGWGEFCGWDGACGMGVYLGNSTLIRSGAALPGTPSPHCGAPGVPLVLGGNSTDQVLTPDAPTLELSGNPVPGGVATFTVHAEPGSVVRLNIGAQPQVFAAPGILVENLVIKSRSFDLGMVPASGIAVKNVSLSPLFPQGYRLFAQARLVYPWNGEVRRTASALTVVR